MSRKWIASALLLAMILGLISWVALRPRRPAQALRTQVLLRYPRPINSQIFYEGKFWRVRWVAHEPTQRPDRDWPCWPAELEEDVIATLESQPIEVPSILQRWLK